MTLASAVLLAALGATADRLRVALLVGDDVGLAGEQPLAHTGDDADRQAAVLVELGGFDRSDVRVLKGKTAAEILDEVDRLAKGPAASLFVFYYSGHADSVALHTTGTVLPVDLLLHRLRSVEAELRLTVLDACQSGAAARAKGVSPGEPFDIRVQDQGSEGDILISSSAAGEQSFETEHGGLFTLSWTAGLRGAADANGDGRVTLSEAFEYSYSQTLRSTLVASSGPQHARFRYEISGHRDPVLTELSGAGALTVRTESDGEYVIFDGRERSVVAELRTRPGEAHRLALSPGDYVVQHRGTRALRIARIQLARGDDKEMREHQMQEVPLLRLARKGSPGEARLATWAGQYGSGLGPRGALLTSVGPAWEGPHWLRSLDLGFSFGSERHADLYTRDVFVQASAASLYTLRIGETALRVGPVAGLAYMRQSPTGQRARQGLGLTLGARLQLEAQLTQVLGLRLMLDGRLLGARTERAPPRPGRSVHGIGIMPWGAYGIGFDIAL